MLHVNPILKINPEFKNLIRPLRRKELLQLEENLLADGCREPIITWKGFIVDGHNRYELCSKHGIPFQVLEKEFSSKEEVITTFMALLELIKMQVIRVKQDDIFTDIQIEKTGDEINGELI